MQLDEGAFPADADPLRGGVPAGGSGGSGGSVGAGPGAYPYGRERESGAVDACLGDPDGPRLVVVMGERGAGRTTFVREAVRRQHAAGTAAMSVECLPGDGDRPLLLALRLVRALEQCIPDAVRQRRQASSVTAMLAAIEQGDRAAAAEALTTALAQSAVTVVGVDDGQHADPESLGILDGLDFEREAPRVRFVFSLLQPVAAVGRCSVATGRVESHSAARVIQLPPLEREEVAALLTRRLHAAPDEALTGLVHRLSRGVPAAVDVLLTEWVRQDAIQSVGGRALLTTAAAIPVLPAHDPFIAALHALGEPAVTVASALSMLWPLGRQMPEPAAAATGLPADVVHTGLADLVAAGIVEELPAAVEELPAAVGEPAAAVGELPAAGDGGARGWTFRLPLVEHAVREQLGPLGRGKLAKAAVEALWAAGLGRPGSAILEEADIETFLPDRIAEAGELVDRERAAAELTAAAARTATGSGRRRAARWLHAAAGLVEDPGAHSRLMLSYTASAVVAHEYAAARETAEALLRDSAGTGGFTAEMHLDAVSLLVQAVAAEGDFTRLSRMAGERWWDELRVPALTRTSGRVMALCALSRWQEVLELLVRTEQQWSGTAAAVPLALCRALVELVLGRPERFRRSLTSPENGGLPAQAGAVTAVQVNQLLGLADLRGATDLLAARRMAVEDLSDYSRFLWHHLAGRWEEALVLALRLFANRQPGTPVLGHRLFPDRATAILLARGRISKAVRLVGLMREDVGGAVEYEHLLCRAEAEASRVLGDLPAAEQALRRGLEAARACGEVFGTDELWAELALVRTDAGDLPGARECLRHLERIAERTDGERTRLLWLLGSARLLGAESGRPDTVRKHLLDAVALARRRGQPFETGVTLLAAARQDEDPAETLAEAYELFGGVGSLLWRFRTRAEMRRARLSLPGRDLVTAENEQLLATLVSDGLTNRQVATVLGLSPDAVANRLTRLFARTGARSRTELVMAVTKGRVSMADW